MKRACQVTRKTTENRIVEGERNLKWVSQEEDGGSYLWPGDQLQWWELLFVPFTFLSFLQGFSFWEKAFVSLLLTTAIKAGLHSWSRLLEDLKSKGRM